METVSRPMSASIGLSAASEKGREFFAFTQNTHSATVPGKEMPFAYVTLATDVTLATARYSRCLFEYATIGLARHNRTHVSQSEHGVGRCVEQTRVD